MNIPLISVIVSERRYTPADNKKLPAQAQAENIKGEQAQQEQEPTQKEAVSNGDTHEEQVQAPVEPEEHQAIYEKPLHELQESPVMVFIKHDSKESTVLNAIKKHSKDGEKAVYDSNMNKAQTAQLNAHVNESIEEDKKAGKLQTLHPKSAGKRTTTYGDGDASLTQHEDDNGKISFKPGKDFTGIITVQRKGPNGELLKDQKDVIEYKNGKPIAVSLATKGECRVANIAGIQKNTYRGVSVVSGEVELAQAQKLPYPTPVVRKNNKGQNKSAVSGGVGPN